MVRSEVKRRLESSFQKQVACLLPRMHKELVCAARCQTNYVLLESHRSVVPTQSDVMMCVLGKGSRANMDRVWGCVGIV